MNTVTISSKFQVVIPQKVRQMLGLKAGHKLIMLAYNNRIVLIPDQPIEAARGSLKGLDTHIDRDEEERV
jgi:AbrB family looped-hinge helix DNA binding protein